MVLKILPGIDDRENGEDGNEGRESGVTGITQIPFMSNDINFYGRPNGEPQSCRTLC